ncbi:MAG: PIG-L family deacetylase [Sulfobacillus acidophilus]|uniref:PIG-L family deacetylase n=1 Tax=Sulfobacillus acidophilus TaxID=53633 RepID=A0A2T2WFX5_9FIRM|nr:MAG: PIG-L family deacetylase [Sulfobacillus acidophilus]
MADRWLVVAPHPDDESLGAGGLMAKARDQGDEVFVAFVTCGDGFVEDATRYYLSLDVTPSEYLHMGYERQTESKHALAQLGVSEDHIYFLGFPDGGIDALWLTHWSGESFTSRTTQFNHVPYLTAWQPDVPYLGEQLWLTLKALYQEVRPSVVAMPSSFDTHPDHWGTNAFATLAWAQLAHHDDQWRAVRRWGYLVHWPTWPLPLSYRPHMPQEAPRSLLHLGQEPWQAERISARQVEQKRQALLAHGSQTELIKPFMLAFCRSTEVFAHEDRWPKDEPRRDALRVLNPGVRTISRVLRRGNPLGGVRWGRKADRDFAEVQVLAGTPADSELEVGLTIVGDSVRHIHWLTSSPFKPPEVRISRQPGTVLMTWPKEWIGSAHWVMAGVRIFSRGKCEGKIPFRLIPWPTGR